MNGSTRALALWSGAAAFFGAILSFEAVGLLVSGANVRIGISALLTAAATGAVVYSKVRRDAAAEVKAKRQAARRP